jgi:outer membrane protein OmpA-like peptidoglycan-associated protein
VLYNKDYEKPQITQNDTVSNTKSEILTNTISGFSVFYVVENISFELNKYKTDISLETLRNISDFLISNPNSNLKIIGYTDISGKEKTNQELSQKRADFVKSKLIEFGVNKNQLIAVGYGVDNPIAINYDNNHVFIEKSAKYNRRVEFVVDNSNLQNPLIVKPITVPKEFKINYNSDVFYSILLKETDTKNDINLFPNATVEFQKNNIFYYYLEKTTNIEELKEKLSSIKLTFPNAVIFENNL